MSRLVVMTSVVEIVIVVGKAKAAAGYYCPRSTVTLQKLLKQRGLLIRSVDVVANGHLKYGLRSLFESLLWAWMPLVAGREVLQLVRVVVVVAVGALDAVAVVDLDVDAARRWGKARWRGSQSKVMLQPMRQMQVVNEYNAYAKIKGINLVHPVTLVELMKFIGILFFMTITDRERAAPSREEPNLFPERSSGLYELRALTEPRYSPPRGEDVPLGPVISNPLDKAQSEQVAAQMALMRSQRPELRPQVSPSAADYGFRPRDPAEACRLAFQQALALHAIGPAARTPEELALRTSLRKRLLIPQSTISVPATRTYPVVLGPGEDSIKYDVLFEFWAEHSRKLSSMEALRASFSEVDVRIECKLRFDFVKVRAKRSLAAITQPQTQFSAARFAPSSTPAAPSREGLSAVAQGQPRSNVADQQLPSLLPESAGRPACRP
ncbi:hypothetical protein PHYSODRAFT_325036 [Phytophthora sojae]|uniref:Uncharacterized protein n=1 Tax=Phytophthora sojae (strain P6497) TaxID=1094619 RepID=G4YXJ9_PHYSP|nr:hypothetical protein PHYSODRAFT_325036 [Phytophthora sojae]EGZ23860.1 hypothetical protein PHYSODRAFT_325036 [Phytophthora sojae]|eukprot:XP_009519148.1 hypothetical protein PHYSODRAFT_325036 [Phytophthora sojae]